jgi:hypothetical protein
MFQWPGFPPAATKLLREFTLIGTWVAFQDVDHSLSDGVVISLLNSQTKNSKLRVNIYESHVTLLLIPSRRIL